MADVWVVTGGIGSGKSTIRETMAGLGALSIDADRIGHSVLEPDGPAFGPVSDRWPSVVVDGRIDRARLGSIVFSDTNQLQELERITHPAISADIAQQIADAGNRVVAVEVSVPRDIVGVGWLRTIVADLDVSVRVDRLVARGMDPEEVLRRMRAQPDREGWRARGRWIISTAGPKSAVAKRVERLWREVIRPE